MQRLNLLVASAIVVAWSLAAVSAPGPVSAPGASPLGKGPLHAHADKVVYQGAQKLMHLEGHVHFDMQDTRIETSVAEFNTETQAGLMTGGVHIIQPGTTVDSSKLLIFYDRRRAVLTGGVKLVTTRSQPGATPAASAEPTVPTTLTCNEMEYLWEQHVGNATGGVRVEQGDKRATSDTAHYDEVTQRVTLQGHVQFAQGNGNWMRAPVAYLNMKDQTFEADNGVDMQMIPSDADHTPQPTGSGQPGPTGPRVMVPALAPQLQPVGPQALPPEMMSPSPKATP